MREKHIAHLNCPVCRGALRIDSVTSRAEDRIETGNIKCAGCGAEYPIRGFIPRFVPLENYASGFGLEWTRHARTQYDSYSGLPLSRTRYLEETRWPERLDGECLLEAGSGSGRFTEHAVSTGAFVVSLDYSYAVEANYASNGHNENLLIVQGDIYAMPFSHGVFDKLFCFGVLQHTPDPRKAFLALPPYLKENGELVVDVYKKDWRGVLGTKYLLRLLTKRMAPRRLYGWTRRYVDFMWPLCGWIRRIPKIGPMINWALCVADYSRRGLKDPVLKEWAYLDTFDMLAPRYDYPQTLASVRRWFDEADLEGVEVRDGYNGIEGRGRIHGR